MIRVKLTLLTQQTLLHINPSHEDEPFQFITPFDEIYWHATQRNHITSTPVLTCTSRETPASSNMATVGIMSPDATVKQMKYKKLLLLFGNVFLIGCSEQPLQC